MAKFLVDDITENQLTAFTHQIDKFMHNLQIIGMDYYNAFMEELELTSDEGLMQICGCGRYITFIQLSKDKKKGQMIFIDVQNDMDKALDAAKFILKQDGGDKYLKVFMEEFQKISPHYEENYYAAELIKDTSALN